MDATTASLIAAAIRATIELWANHSGKPSGWQPTAEELSDILSLNEKTPADFYKEAAERLGVEWPPKPPVTE